MIDAATQQYLDRAQRSREEQYLQLFADLDAYGPDRAAPDSDELPEEAIDESVLSVDRNRGFAITISTGGPGEWLECGVDEDGDLIAVAFCVAWWSPVQRTTVNEGDALWRLASRMNPYQFD